MTAHTHTDDRLTFGCLGCIAAAEVARWENAPRRHVRWVCTYLANDADELVERTLSFTLAVRVPDGATGREVDEHYPDLTGEAFTLALPDDVPIGDTVSALETMDVRSVSIGALVDTPTAPETMPLFGGAL